MGNGWKNILGVDLGSDQMAMSSNDDFCVELVQAFLEIQYLKRCLKKFYKIETESKLSLKTNLSDGDADAKFSYSIKISTIQGTVTIDKTINGEWFELKEEKPVVFTRHKTDVSLKFNGTGIKDRKLDIPYINDHSKAIYNPHTVAKTFCSLLVMILSGTVLHPSHPIP